MSVCVTLVVSMTRLSDQSKGTFFALSLYCWSVWSLNKTRNTHNSINSIYCTLFRGNHFSVRTGY